MSEAKARAIRELSRSLSHSPRNVTSPSLPRSDTDPTRNSFGSTSNFFDDPDILMSTQHRLEDETNTLPQFPRIRSTAKKMNSWQLQRSEQPGPDTSMVNKEFGDFDHSISDEEVMSIEQARGVDRNSRGTPNKSSQFNSLYDMTPPTNRSRKSYAPETGSLRRDAQLRRASRNDYDTASPRPASKRNSPALTTNHERKRTSLAALHAKVSEDESSFMDQRPPTLTVDSTKNTRWGNRSRHTSLQLDGMVENSPRANTTARSRPGTAHNATGQSFILPDIPNLTELVSGVFDDGTPVFSKTAPARSRFSAPPNGGRRPQHIPVEGIPIPSEEKAIFAGLQQLQEKVAQMESERAEHEKRIEEQELELIELKAMSQAQDKLRRSDSAQDSDSAGKSGWKVEKTRLEASVQTLRTKLDRADRKTAVLEIEKKRLSSERDNMATQLGVAFQTCEELKHEKTALVAENDELRQEIDSLRAENEQLRDQFEQDLSQHREETVQLRRQFDQTANATERENANLQAELARVRAQHDDNTQQLSRKDIELRKARQEQAEFARLKADHESLKAQLANMKTKREEEVQRWSRKESELKKKVDRRDETIRQFEDLTQGETNDAIRIDNENLRNELARLAQEHEEEIEQWTEKERDLQRKIQRREDAARRTLDMTREVLAMRQDNDQQTEGYTSKSKGKENQTRESLQRKPSLRRDDTRTRIRNQVQQEVRNSRAVSAAVQSSRAEESPRKSYTGFSRFSNKRSVSAPITVDKNATVESEVESTTDLSLAPRTMLTSRSILSSRPATTIQPPADLDLTELSFINSNDIAQLRRKLEEERAAARQAAEQAEQGGREDTVRSQRQIREDTGRSIASAKSERRPSLVRKSSLKEHTQRTQFEEDVTGKLSNLDADNEATQTKQSAIDASMLSNTSRRRRSAPNEMTSAFIVPDIKLGTLKQATTTLNLAHRHIPKDHDNVNCTVCRREGLSTSNADFRVPKLIPVSVRTADDVDATLRPSRSPKEALALVVKELHDERAHLHAELAVSRAMLECHDPSLGNRKRLEYTASCQDLLSRISVKEMQIYHLYDVLEGQQNEDITEADVEELTREIRMEDAAGPAKEKKKVTIRSFVDESEDESMEVGREAQQEKHEHEEEGDTQELPWEGFEDDGEGDVSFSALQGWRSVR
ncbi:hypothetical protein NX059_007932 [Plenodomus lindquistii]|nr:hypothetical protein NX059_007932 [Plenodomus lindquistii]